LSSVRGLAASALGVGTSSSQCGATVMEYYCGGWAGRSRQRWPPSDVPTSPRTPYPL